MRRQMLGEFAKVRVGDNGNLLDLDFSRGSGAVRELG